MRTTFTDEMRGPGKPSGPEGFGIDGFDFNVVRRAFLRVGQFKLLHGLRSQ